ncbi:MAG TPA: flagellar biosynthesis protein FlhA [Bryobacteraceae bacterium]|nr:flagellar biosynthesis protein FlhA [Bryobacteraceae bacterium]
MSSQPQVLAAPARKAAGKKLTLPDMGELSVPIAVLAIVVALITPLPSAVLDILIVLDIMMSVVVMMVTLYILRPVEFNVFPTALLLLTLFRLALNVSSARLILLNGNSGTAAAGSVIEAFGNFVVGGNYVIGAVIFLILIAIQYVVINHGAVRISEVSARFTLDALPGKQMSIDAEMNAGLIDEVEARRRRKHLAAEAEFYGAMDGASRFTQRDAVASILITSINIIAGFLIGVLQHGMELRHALETYTVLTIGDGLVTVIPALMISVSGGLIVTRSNSDVRVGTEFQRQLFGKPEPLLLSSGVLLVLAAFPGLPAIPFLLLGGGLGAFGWIKRKNIDRSVKEEAAAAAPALAPKDDLESLLRVEPLAIEVGLGLAGLVAGGKASPLLKRIAGIRRQFVNSLGYLLPPVRVTDNLSLRSREYVVLLKGSEIGRYELMPGSELAIPTSKADKNFSGQQTREPAFSLPALWIAADKVDAARGAGYTVVDAVNILGTHLAELVRRHSSEMFSRQDAKMFCDRIGQENPKLLEDLVPKLLSFGVIQKVLQNLLRERVSIRDGVSILEALSEAAGTTKNPVLLTEYTRQSIRRMVVKPYLNQKGELPAFFLDSAVEQTIESAVQHSEQNSVLVLSPQLVHEVVSRLERTLERREVATVVMVSSGGRYFLRQMLESSLPNVFPISHNEVPAGVKILSLGAI